MGVVGNGAAMAPATIVLTRNAPQTLAQHLSAASMEPLVPSPEAMSTFFTPLPPSKYRYYSPSQKHLDAMGTPLGSASAPGFAGDGDGVGFTIKTEKKEVRPLNLREAMSSEQRLLQNEQYRTVVQAKLRVAKAIMEKADLKQQTRYQKILMPTGITRSTNTSSMCTTTNRIMHNSFNIKRLASRQRENSREESRRRAHNLKTEMVTSLQMAKRRLRETKNLMGDQQRKEKAETDFISAQLKLKSFEMTRHTVQGRKHVHDVMSSIQASEQGFARRFQCSQNMMVHSNLNQVVKTEHKFAQKRNKKRVEKMVRSNAHNTPTGWPARSCSTQRRWHKRTHTHGASSPFPLFFLPFFTGERGGLPPEY